MLTGDFGFLDKIEEIGKKIEKRMYSNEQNMSGFKFIANEEINSFPTFDAEDIISSLAENIHTIGTQWAPKHTFGDQRFTLFTGSNFVIELNCWQKNQTSIHEHSFSGAFKIICGEAIHSRYKFKTKLKFSDYLETGELKKISSKALKTGDGDIIHLGDEFIHNLVHVCNPTFTLIIRSISGEGNNIAQRDYIGDSFASFGWYYSEISHNAKSCVGLILKCDISAESKAQKLITIFKELNFSDTFHVLYSTWTLTDYSRLSNFIELLCESHNNGDLIKNAIDSIKKHYELTGRSMSLREKITSNDVRLLFAILSESRNSEEAIKLFKEFKSESLNKHDLLLQTIKALNVELEIWNKEMTNAITELLPEILDTNRVDDSSITLIRERLSSSIFSPLLN